MTKLSFAVSPVALEVQGAAFTVDPTEFAPVALEGVFVYGVRRWFQDNINGAAHTFKLAKAEAEKKGETFNDGKPFDVAAAFAARLESAKSGILSTRGTASAPAFTPLEVALYDLAYAMRGNPKFAPIATALKDAKGADTDTRKRAVLAAIDSLDPALAAKLRATAQATVDAMAALGDL